MKQPRARVGGLWWSVSLVAVALCFFRQPLAAPSSTVLLCAGLHLASELASVKLPGFGYFSTGFAVVLALSSLQPQHLSWACLILLLSLALRAGGRGVSRAATLADLAPAACALAASSLFVNWQARCLAGIVVYFLVGEVSTPQLARAQDREQMMAFQSTRERIGLYRWAVLFLAPVLVCLHLYDPYYILLGFPLMAGVQRAAYSELSRLQLLDQEILLRKEAQSRLSLAHTQNQLEETQKHLRLREFSERMLLELTRELALSQDLHNTAQAALKCLGQRIHYQQLAVFVVSQASLRPLFWMGHPREPALSQAAQSALASGPCQIDSLHLWPLEGEGALMVSTEGKSPLSEEEIYLIGLVASQTALGLQSARRYRDQQESQAQVLQASKMAAVGQLAAGVAHELNTPLGAVQLQLELLETLPGLPPKAQSCLEVSGKALEHSQKIINRLLYYSREGATERQAVDLSQVVSDTLQLLQRQLQIEGVQVETHLQPVQAVVNANEIQQVLTNLLLNAKDACLEPGARGKKVGVSTSRQGTRVELCVVDQGAGVPEEIRERIFEPFFTSKPVGKGVGLGLSVSQELVRQNEGELRVDPMAPPWSTRFTLTFAAA